MTRKVAVIVAILLSSTAVAFSGATYLLNDRMLYAVALLSLHFIGGVWAPGVKIGMKAHALWIGVSAGFFAAVLFFLPSWYP